MKATKPGIELPSAKIAVNKNIVKQYQTKEGINVYLTGGTEFQIELYNPTQDTVSAKIKLNGNYIGGGGLVIYPAQRVFLDRYITDAKKFKFETYEVSGDDETVKKAIEKNGLVEIEFYREQKVYPLLNINTSWDRNIWGGPTYKFETISNWDGTSLCSSESYEKERGFINDVQCNFFSNSSMESNNITTESLNLGDQSRSRGYGDAPGKKTLRKKITVKETGRVGKGGNSDQELYEVDLKFEVFSFHNITIKILPNSQKPTTAEDLTQMRKYCSSCGTKVKPKDKFCSSCGNKL